MVTAQAQVPIRQLHARSGSNLYLDVVDVNGVLTWRQNQRARLSSLAAVASCASPASSFNRDERGHG